MGRSVTAWGLRHARIDYFVVGHLFAAAMVVAPRVAIAQRPDASPVTITRSPLPSPDSARARELVLVLIGAEHCAAHRNPALVTRYKLFRNRLKREAAAEGRHFRTIGVAVDLEPDAGISFLRPFGPFDQAIVGGGWSNEGAVRFLWKDHRGQPSIPQLVVLRREIKLLPELTIAEEVVVRRAVGVRAILAEATDLKASFAAGSRLRPAKPSTAANSPPRR